jgi:polyphosphate glucokinase
MAELATIDGIRTLAVDIGGSNVKVLVLDEGGEAISEREKRPTPRPALPAAMLDQIVELAERQPAYQRVSVGFPGVVRHGVTWTAPNLHTDWRGFPLEKALEERLGCDVRVCNDADMQGFGAIAGEGLEMVITLGTGLGSALFVDGILVPNLELAHHPFADGRTYEQWLGNASLEDLGEAAWEAKLREAVELMRRIFNYDKLYIGGGNGRLLQRGDVPDDVVLVDNIAGLLGGIALWTGVVGTKLVRAPHSVGAYCPVPAGR